jgi:hypothetical protein
LNQNLKWFHFAVYIAGAVVRTLKRNAPVVPEMQKQHGVKYVNVAWKKELRAVLIVRSL